MSKQTFEKLRNIVGFTLAIFALLGIIWAKAGIPDIDKRIDLKCEKTRESIEKQQQKMETKLDILIEKTANTEGKLDILLRKP